MGQRRPAWARRAPPVPTSRRRHGRAPPRPGRADHPLRRRRRGAAPIRRTHPRCAPPRARNAHPAGGGGVHGQRLGPPRPPRLRHAAGHARRGRADPQSPRLVSVAVLLGPAGPGAVAGEFGRLGVDGPIALVTAGWEERERNDAELDRAVGGGTRNLGLFGRRLDILESDPEYAEEMRRVRTLLTSLREVYLVQLRHALLGVEAVRQHDAGARRLSGVQLDEAIETIRALDERHAARLEAVLGEFYALYPPHERPAIASHRDAVASIVAQCSAVAIAGGHVGVLTDCLHVCNLGAALADVPVVAWSSGAMAIAERVMIVDDHDLGGVPDEVYGAGIGLVRGVVALPASAGRLRIDDRNHLALLARRLAPRICVLLDEGDRIAFVDSGAVDLT